MSFNSKQISKTKKIVAKHKIKRMIPLYIAFLVAIVCICMDYGYSAYNTKLIGQGNITAVGERGEDIETSNVYNFYIFLFVNGTQIEYENSSFWGAFEVTSVLQDSNDETVFYIPYDQLKTIYSTYVGGTLSVGDGGNAVVEYAPNAYYPEDNLAEATYMRIRYKEYLKIIDETSLDPNRINLRITTTATDS